MDTIPPPPLPNNSFYFEVFGNAGFIGSINYERKLFNKNKFNLLGRIGFGFSPVLNRKVFTVPVILTCVFQIFRSISYEIGGGVSFMRIDDNQMLKYDIGYSALMGIRVQSKTGFLFRLNFTPAYYYLDLSESRKQFYPFFGMSFGYSFGMKNKSNSKNN